MYRICCGLFVLLGILLMPTVVFAYVDPGLISSLYQVLYVVIFGAVSTWIIAPWKYIKSLFKRKNKVHVEEIADGAHVEKNNEENKHDNSK
jgi:hypothetical protein